MAVRKPHFLMFCDSTASQNSSATAVAPVRCKWRCVLDNLENQNRIELTDSEAVVAPERGSLIAVVRGLEALEQPSSVTLVTSSPYVNKGLRYGLKEWRENNYHWEHFGTEKPIRNADLWQRIDVALKYHHIDCRLIENAAERMTFPETLDDKPATQSSTFASGSSPASVARRRSRLAAFAIRSVRKSIRLSATAINRVVRIIRRVASQILSLPEQTVFAIEATIDSMFAVMQWSANLLTGYRWGSHRSNFHRGMS